MPGTAAGRFFSRAGGPGDTTAGGATMIKKLMGLGMVVALGLLLLPSAALADKIVIENNTGSTLTELYISNADTNSWEEDVLGRGSIGPGDSVRVDLGRNYMVYDILAKFSNGEEHIYTGINVRKYRNVRLNGNDADMW